VHGVRAEFSAESGLAYAQKRLMNDPYWEGTDDTWIEFSGEQSFKIAITFEEDDAFAGTKAVIRSTGRSSEGEHTLRMEAIIDTGGTAGDAAGVFLSADIEMTQGKLNGDVLIPDVVGAIEDYFLDEDGNPTWELNEDPLGTLAVDTTNAIKTVRQFTETQHFKGNSSIELEDSPYKMPAWDLDAYTEPSDSRMILDGVTSLSGLNTSQTVVVLLDEGDTLTVTDCTLHGGLVVWAPSEYNLRSGARNSVTVSSSNIGTGSDPHIGLMAPAAEVSGSGGGLNFHGLCFWNSIDGLDSAHITGALVVVNGIANCHKLNLNGHPQTLANMPDGIAFQGSGEGITFLTAGEDYGEE